MCQYQRTGQLYWQWQAFSELWHICFQDDHSRPPYLKLLFGNVRINTPQDTYVSLLSNSFMMTNLIGLPDKLLLAILQQVSIESFYCLARACHHLRRLSYDRSLSFRLQPLPAPFQPEDYPRGLLRSPTLPGLCEVELGLFRKPKAYGPPWNFDTADLVGNLSWMHPNDLRNDIYTPDGDAMFEVAKLLLRDTLCSSCWRLRQTPEFPHQLQRLMRPAHCAGCQKFHPRIYFRELPKGILHNTTSRYCIGHTAHFRICAHKRLSWDEYIEACFSTDDFECDQCDTTLNAPTCAIRTHIPVMQPASDPNVDTKDAFSSIRTSLEQSGLRQACPHVAMTDPTFLNLLLHTLRTNGPIELERCQSEPVEKPLLDYGGTPWGCRICKASFHVRYQRSRSGGIRGSTDIDLVIVRPIGSVTSPSDFR